MKKKNVWHTLKSHLCMQRSLVQDSGHSLVPVPNSASQLSLYGAVAEMCEEYEFLHDGSGRPDTVMGQSIVLSEIKTEVPLDCDDPTNQDLLLQQRIWDNIAEKMLLEFAESGCPIFNATTPLSRGKLKNKRHGKLSIHYCAVQDSVQMQDFSVLWRMDSISWRKTLEISHNLIQWLVVNTLLQEKNQHHNRKDGSKGTPKLDPN